MDQIQKEDLLDILQKWRRQHQVETKLDAKEQHALTKFGFTAERPENEEGPTRASVRGRRRRPRRVRPQRSVARAKRRDLFRDRVK